MIRNKDKMLGRRAEDNKIIELLKSISKDKLCAEEIDLHLHASEITESEFNEAILSIFSSIFNPGLVKHEMHETANEIASKVDEESDFIRDMLQEYYRIDNCPSFLYHRAMLHEKDYDFALQIYSEIFKLPFSSNEKTVECVKEMFENYTKNLIEKGNFNSEEDFLRMVEEIDR